MAMTQQLTVLDVQQKPAQVPAVVTTNLVTASLVSHADCTTSSGFTIDSGDFYDDVVPTTRLDSTHPFHNFWRELPDKLSKGCDPFWDAMMSTEYRWVAAGDGTAKISHEALLKATIVHEAAHWAQTLRVGLYPAILTDDQLDHLPPTEQLNMKKKMTPKRFRTFTSGANGESGYYVEVAVFGGVVTLQEGKLTIMASSTTEEAVSIDALRDLRTIGLCRLISPGSSSAAILFPSAYDEELGDKDSKKFPALDVLAKNW